MQTLNYVVISFSTQYFLECNYKQKYVHGLKCRPRQYTHLFLGKIADTYAYRQLSQTYFASSKFLPKAIKALGTEPSLRTSRFILANLDTRSKIPVSLRYTYKRKA